MSKIMSVISDELTELAADFDNPSAKRRLSERSEKVKFNRQVGLEMIKSREATRRLEMQTKYKSAGDSEKNKETERHHRAMEQVKASKLNQAKPLGAADKKVIRESKASINDAKAALRDIKRAKDSLKKINSGGVIAQFADNPKLLSKLGYGEHSDLASANKAIQSALINSFRNLKGAKAVRFLDFLEKTKPSLKNPKETNDDILNEMEIIANEEIKTAKGNLQDYNYDYHDYDDDDDESNSESSKDGDEDKNLNEDDIEYDEDEIEAENKRRGFDD